MGKGSGRRHSKVSIEEFIRHWEAIYGAGGDEHPDQVRGVEERNRPIVQDGRERHASQSNQGD